MQKELLNYNINLFVIFICYITAILSNTHLFTLENITHLLYGVAMIILGGLTLYCLSLTSKNLILSTKISIIIGPIMALMSLIEGFMYGKGFIINFRVTVLFIMIGGILLFNNSRKLINNN